MSFQKHFNQTFRQPFLREARIFTIGLGMNQLRNIEHRLSSWLHKHDKLTGFIAFGVVLLLVVLAFMLNGHLKKQTEIRETAKVIRAIETKVNELIHTSELAAVTLAYAVDADGVPHQFDSVAQHILRTTSFIDVLELVPDGIIKYVYPLEGNESVVGYNILADSNVNREAYFARAKGQMHFAGPLQLKQGGVAVIGRIPIYRDGKFWGFSAVLIHLDNLLEYIGLTSHPNSNYAFQFSKVNPNTGKEHQFLPVPENATLFLEHEIASFPEGQWKVHVMRVNNSGGSLASFVLLSLGFLFATFVGFVVYAHLKRERQLSRAHTKLAWQHQEITDSIYQARHLQAAVLQNESELKQLFPNSFTIFRPKNVVSGDFFWTHETDTHKIIAVVDCTGHGVSAALMSMIASELLYRAIVVGKELNPATVLALLNKRLFELLQTNNNQCSMDGMDMLLCVFEKNTTKLTFAGANRPLYLARNGEIKELKGTRASIGGHEATGRKKEFKQVELMLKKHDMLYLTSDGYHSQFGGELGKIMGKRAFRLLMQSVAKLNVETQMKHLTSDFDRWKRKEDQVDDVLVVGIRI